MNEAIKIGTEFTKDLKPQKEMDYDGLKMGINNLLHTHLPGKTTLDETEINRYGYVGYNYRFRNIYPER